MSPVTRRHRGFLIRSLLALGLFVGLFATLVAQAAASAPAPRTFTAKFEVRFMENMIDHHEKAVKEGQMCMEPAYHQELISLCQNIVSSQSAEIQQMQTWLCDWSGICKQE